MHPDMHPDWIIPDWPAHSRVRAFCTTRAGGVSTGSFGSLNLGLTTGDTPAAVAANWARVQAALDAASRSTGASPTPPIRPVPLLQVHGTRVLELDAETPAHQRADASSTSAVGVACVAMAADCLPVLLCNRAGTRVAAAHAGWRGLAGGVLEAAVASFKANSDASPGHPAIKNEASESDELLAWIGPGIGMQAFEVGAEVFQAFSQHDGAAARHFSARPGGKYLADLAGLARQRLQAAGVGSIGGNDGAPAWCTALNASRFFSYRRDPLALGGTGRMAAFIWRVA